MVRACEELSSRSSIRALAGWRRTQFPNPPPSPERTAMRFIAYLLFAAAAALAWPAAGQDIPGRVGRISAIEGSVGLYQDPDRGWEEAYVNSPLTSRNSVWTDPDARAEVVVGPMAVRLDGQSQLDVSLLDDATF